MIEGLKMLLSIRTRLSRSGILAICLLAIASPVFGAHPIDENVNEERLILVALALHPEVSAAAHECGVRDKWWAFPVTELLGPSRVLLPSEALAALRKHHSYLAAGPRRYEARWLRCHALMLALSKFVHPSYVATAIVRTQAARPSAVAGTRWEGRQVSFETVRVDSDPAIRRVFYNCVTQLALLDPQERLNLFAWLSRSLAEVSRHGWMVD